MNKIKRLYITEKQLDHLKGVPDNQSIRFFKLMNQIWKNPHLGEIIYETETECFYGLTAIEYTVSDKEDT